MDSKPSTSRENLKIPKKVEVDYKTGKWYSRIVPPKKSTTNSQEEKCMTPKKSKEKDQEVIMVDFPSPKKRCSSSTSSVKVVKKRKYLSPSAKLESKIPKVDDLLKEREEAKKFQEIDKLIQKSSTRFFKELKNNNQIKIKEKPKTKVCFKDCKHLTQKQLERRFHKDINYVDGIFNGTIYSERHELFKKQLNKVSCSLKEDLRVNGESLGVFTSDQLVFIVSLFRDKYDNGNKYKYSDYYFKVLLPEYCLKIFMDCYKMEKDKALEYLSKVPIPDLFGLMM